MGKYRIYPDKGNTLIEGTELNTGLNEVMELWYGNEGIARYLIHFNFDTYNEKYLAGNLPHITATTASFHLEPCYPIFEKYPYETSSPAESSRVDVKIVQQYWDNGVGHDFWGTETVDGKSNWYSATSTSHWAAPGGDFLYTVFSGIVDNGYEALDIPVIDEIELWNSFTGHNYGLVVKFNDDVEDLSGSTKHILKYYSHEAWTKYKTPYIELTWNDQITDQRNEVHPNSTKRLYFYLKKNGTFTNAANISGVSISFSNSALTVTSSTIHNPVKGMYYIDFVYPSSGVTGITFNDAWAVQYETGMTHSIITQTGLTIPTSSVWASSSSIEPVQYTIVVPNMMSKYTFGDIIYLQIDCYTPYTNTLNVLKNMEYKLDLIDGQNLISFSDWDDVSYTSSENFITLDTSWLIAGYQYALSLRYTIDGSLSSEAITKKFWIK